MKLDTEQLETAYLNLKAQTLRSNDRLADFMNINNDPVVHREINEQIIERAVKSLVEDHKQKFEELMSLKEKVTISEKVRAEEDTKSATKYAHLQTEFEEYKTITQRKQDKLRAE